MFGNLGSGSIPNFQLAGGYMFGQFQDGGIDSEYQSSTAVGIGGYSMLLLALASTI